MCWYVRREFCGVYKNTQEDREEEIEFFNLNENQRRQQQHEQEHRKSLAQQLRYQNKVNECWKTLKN